MDKLLGLLNEYEEVKYGRYGEYEFVFDGCIRSRKDAELLNETIISKKFGFIKWLVDNDKIDKKKIDTRLVKSVESHYDVDGWWVENSYEDYSDIDTLLMLLSISDTPIEDLISYLK